MNYTTDTIMYWAGKGLLFGVIVYFGIIGIINPSMFAGMIPGWMAWLPAHLLIVVHGIVMVITALLVFGNKGGRWAYYLLILCILGVIMSVSGKTLARDLAIMGGLLMMWPKTTKPL